MATNVVNMITLFMFYMCMNTIYVDDLVIIIGYVDDLVIIIGSVNIILGLKKVLTNTFEIISLIYFFLGI